MEEAGKMEKLWTELGEPGEEEMVSLSLQEHLSFPFFFQSPKVLHFSSKWAQGEIVLLVVATR